jgi:hypothetical protein
MAAFRQTGTRSVSGGSVTSLAFTEPASSVDGELHAIALQMGDPTGHNLAAAGWTNVLVTATGGGNYLVTGQKIRSGSSGFTLTWTNSSFARGLIYAVSGTHASSPVESVTAGALSGASVSKVGPAVSSTYDNSLVIDVMVEEALSTFQWVTDVDYSLFYHDNAQTGLGICERQLSATGVTGPDTHTSVGSTGGLVHRLIIVDDAPTPPVATVTGTATANITESDIVAGGKTIIITLTNTTWIA